MKPAVLIDEDFTMFSKPYFVTHPQRTNLLKEYTETSKWNYSVDNKSKVGVIASGMSYEYAWEALGETVDYLKLGFTYPLPRILIDDFCKEHDTVYIIEENDPIIEEFARLNNKNIIGKDLFPYTGEMTPDVIKRCILSENIEGVESNTELFVGRPPTFCSGCPHRGFFYELGKKRKKLIVAGDIGCYSLAVGEPYNMMDWLICMGAAYSTAHGAQRITNLKEDDDRRLVAVMGDSTFFHTGMNSLLNTVYNGGNTINVILDNRTTSTEANNASFNCQLTHRRSRRRIVTNWATFCYIVYKNYILLYLKSAYR
mgnify:CR=1 FL=1